MKVDLDLHKYPAAVRFKFLELLGIKQKTTGAPKEELRLNIVEHFKDGDREGLKKRTEWLSSLLASEGNVVSAAARSYQLTSGRRPYQLLKYHNSSQFTTIVLDAIETKTKGVYNLKYAVLAGDRPIQEKVTRMINGKKAVYVGKSFAVKEKIPRGEAIIIEAETVNIIYDIKKKAYDITFWAPRYLGKTDKKPQTIDEVESQAIKDRIFQAKLIDKDGKIHYLPGASTEEVSSKEIEDE